MRNKVILMLVFCLLGGLSLGAVELLERQSVRMEERSVLLEQKAGFVAELEAAKQQLPEVEAELAAVREELSAYTDELEAIRGDAAALQETCRADEVLYGIQTGGLPVNYDVENFREKQRENEQSGALGGAFGSLLGNLMQGDMRNYAADGQQNRYLFYEKLTDFLEESYWEALEAETAFDGAYLYYQRLGSPEDEAELFADRGLLEGAGSDPYGSEREAYLHALAKYTFDLNCVRLIYGNTLTDHETSFLNGLQGQVDGFASLLTGYDAAGSYTGMGESMYGYSPEEKTERWLRVLRLYVQAAKQQTDYTGADGGLVSDSNLTAYHVGTINGYSNRGDIVLIVEKGSTYNTDEWEYRIYDHEGNPLYLEEHQGIVYLMNGEVVAFQAATDALQTQEVCDRLVDNAERMLTDYVNGVLGQTYQNYAY